MSLRTPIRTALLFAAVSPLALAQGVQPSTNSTTVPPAEQRPAPATVTYTEGRISVTAENASLNQILHAISDRTGMKITGGVRDERVYGIYGPAAPAAILAQLLDGTGSNMLLVQSSGAAPTELILTPRNGGPTPPSPNSDNSNYYPPPRGENPRGPIGSRVITARRPPQQPNLPNPPEMIANPPQGSVQQPSSTTGQPTPPARTPQQIYNDIQEQRRQQLQNGEITEE